MRSLYIRSIGFNRISDTNAPPQKDDAMNICVLVAVHHTADLP